MAAVMACCCLYCLHPFFFQFVSVIEQTEDQASSLLSNFNDPTTSDIIVHYLRLLASSYLQNRAEFFQHFVEAPNLRDFCVQVSKVVYKAM